MSDERLSVMSPGLFFVASGEAVLQGWALFQQPGSDTSPDQIIVTIRDYIVQALDKRIEDPSLRTGEDFVPEPVSTAIERDAEMETILLMSRCMGYG